MPDTWKTTGKLTGAKKSTGKFKSMQGSSLYPCIFLIKTKPYYQIELDENSNHMDARPGTHAGFQMTTKSKLHYYEKSKQFETNSSLFIWLGWDINSHVFLL